VLIFFVSFVLLVGRARTKKKMTMKLRVATLAGANHVLTVSPNDTLERVKEVISSDTYIPVAVCTLCPVPCALSLCSFFSEKSG
jgi:hypothetical protein